MAYTFTKSFAVDQKITARRRKYSKNRRVNYTEGWVEFKDKKKAKSLAAFLNMKQIGKRANQRYRLTHCINICIRITQGGNAHHSTIMKCGTSNTYRNSNGVT